MKKKKILFVCPYPFGEAPSQRFRFEQYLSILEENGFEFKLAPFLNLKAWRILYQSGNGLQKLFWLKFSFVKRFFQLFRLNPYEFIFIHREATPIGPPFFEWVVRYLWRKKIIYDFDDAIWLDDPNEKGTIKARLKWKSKVKHICKWSHRVSCGNKYLGQYAKTYNKHVVINPTTIDTDYHKEIPIRNPKKIVIGWTGTQSTLPYLKPILPVLDKVLKYNDFELLVISNQKPDFDVSYMRFIPWNKSTEIEDLNQMDIGIMPLTDDVWSKGKCGFKILQYMAIKKPVIASSVGININLITESKGGYLALNQEEWFKYLSELINNQLLRTELGDNGYKYLKRNYSVDSNKNNFLKILK